jgi:hypothetical protein
MVVDHINYFRVYNRWGSWFLKRRRGKGCRRKLNGQLQLRNLYMDDVVVDFDGHVIFKRGSVFWLDESS